MNMSDKLEKAKRRMLRYRVLRTLQIGYPRPVGETLISEVVVDADLAATPTEIRSALTYLGDSGYVELNQAGEYWEAKLLPKGVNFLEDDSIKDPGIARPACA
jgi:hypothetical protein